MPLSWNEIRHHAIRLANNCQSLGALLKSARDIMRKDEGLNGGLGCGSRQD